MMSPSKNKRGGPAVTEASPEDGRSAGQKLVAPDCSGDNVEENVPKRGGTIQNGPNSLRSLGFNGQKKPAELFRKDLISAMKLADKDSLPEESYFLISDPWRQEWEKGVQVPVNVTDIKQAKVKEVHEKKKTGDFKMPHKLLHERVDEVYKKGMHELTGMPELVDQLVRYDLDDLDVCWLEELNFRYREMGLTQINEWNMERVIEALESECHKNMTELIKTEEGMGIEYDEDVICDVCRSPESEESNEMVFCDKCDICVHQACYGIKTIPEGSWMCRTCAMGVKPTCMLCPNLGGAMKCTRSGAQWVHVSCALWIPEVGFGDPDKVEPVTKISHIPPSRWSLTCCLCKEREGACIQCSIKSCKTAFHVTCAFNEGLLMRTILDERGDSEDVKLKAFCPKHSKRQERSHSESEADTPRKKGSLKDSPHKRSPRKDSPPTPKKHLTQEERADLRSKKLKSLEEEFYKVVNLSQMSKNLQLDEEVISVIFVYWKFKRKCNWDRPLLTPKTEEEDILERQEEDSRVARRKLFVHLRHDLERVRNLCYMISKREKMKRQLFHNKEHVFKSMARVLKNKSLNLSKANVTHIVQNYHFESIYDDYGRSVLKLPGEQSEEEESSEADDSMSASSVSTIRTDDTAAQSRKKLTPSSRAVEPEATPKPGRPRKNHLKTRRKGATAKKMKELENQALASVTEASASPVKNDGGESDDNVLVMSADESEDETVRRLPGAMASKSSRWSTGKGSTGSASSTFSLSPRRVRQKKPRRGRKPWYEKRNRQCELTPNLALSTDDDEDTKGMSGEGEGEGCREGGWGEDKGSHCEENVMVDVIGDGEAEECTEGFVAPKPKPNTDGISGRQQKPASKREVKNSRRKVDNTQVIKSDSVQTNSDTRTTLSDVAFKCNSILNKGESISNVENIKEVEGVCRVLSFLPTRTSNRKRRKSQNVVSCPELAGAKLQDFLHEKSGDAVKVCAKMKTEPSDEPERTSSLSLAKVRKSNRSYTRTEMMNFEKDNSPTTREVHAGSTEKTFDPPEFVQQSRLSPSSKHHNEKSDPLSDSTGVQGESKSQNSRTSSETPSELTVANKRESSPPVRKGRLSSYRARLMLNKLLPAPGEIKPRKSSLGKTSQPRGKHCNASGTFSSPDDHRVNGRTIKQEKDAEKLPDNVSIEQQQNIRGKSPSLLSLDLNDSKPVSGLAPENLTQTVRNGFRKRHSRQGKRRLLVNGVLDSKQRKIDAFFSKAPVESLDSKVVDDEESPAKPSPTKCVQNEKTPEKRGSGQTTTHLRNHTNALDAVGKHDGEQQQQSGSQGRGVNGDCVRKKDNSSGGDRELDTVSAFTRGQCETDQFSLDTLRAFRSQSPSSDASTIIGLRTDSRESTPRRFTRSQLADVAAESSACLPQDGDRRKGRRAKSRSGNWKSSKAAL
ncbi:uncharacterized protein LOC143298551 [Babylonia areolata]|uniref:uncharacterized protein LOC143298551 n=1 Tax=Babylonia areolata TaxID=304850 RepID=UPI003FD68AD8